MGSVTRFDPYISNIFDFYTSKTAFLEHEISTFFREFSSKNLISFFISCDYLSEFVHILTKFHHFWPILINFAPSSFAPKRATKPALFGETQIFRFFRVFSTFYDKNSECAKKSEKMSTWETPVLI